MADTNFTSTEITLDNADLIPVRDSAGGVIEYTNPDDIVKIGAPTAGAEIVAAAEGETDKNFVTDAEKTVIGNTSGTNTGDKDVVDDTTPQLGGTLDGNDKEINNFKGTINAQTGTTYPTVASDTGKVITLNNASPVTITVHSTAAAGFNCTIIQKGAGQVTVAAGGTGAILNKSSHTKLSGQYAIGALFVESNAGTAPQVYFGGDTAA